MPFVIRVHGWDYSKTPPRVLCYMCKDGTISEARRYAHIFDTEAEAWDRLIVLGEIGQDSEGPWAWVEPVDS